MDEKESYWISHYDSYHNGYNCSVGGKSLRGEEHPRAILTEEIVWEIREMYKMHIPKSVAYETFKDTDITERGFKKVWDYETWSGIHEDVYTEENK